MPRARHQFKTHGQFDCQPTNIIDTITLKSCMPSPNQKFILCISSRMTNDHDIGVYSRRTDYRTHNMCVLSHSILHGLLFGTLSDVRMRPSIGKNLHRDVSLRMFSNKMLRVCRSCTHTYRPVFWRRILRKNSSMFFSKKKLQKGYIHMFNVL